MTWKLLSLGCLCRKRKSRRRSDCGGSTVFKLADEMDQEVDLFSFDISVEASDERQCAATGKYDEMSLLSNKNSDASENSLDKEKEEAVETFLPPALKMFGKEPLTATADENDSSFLRALADTTTAVAGSSLSSSLDEGASAKNSSCLSSTSSTSFLVPPPQKPPVMSEASYDSCPKNDASEEIESVLSNDQGQVLIVSSFSSTYAADDTDEDMPMDELHHWRENPRPPKQKKWILLPPPPPPLPPPPPPKTSPQKEKIHHNIIHDDTNDSMDADIESFQAKNSHKGNRRSRSTSIATRREKSSKSSGTTHSSYLSQSQENNHTNVFIAATSTKQPLLQTTIKPWYSLSSANPNINKINVRPKEFTSTSMEKPIQRSFVLMEEGHPITISPSISSSDGSFTSDPFSDLSSYASPSKASSSNHGIVVIVSDEDTDEDEEKPHEMLYHHSFRVLGTTTTSYAEGDEDKYDTLSYNFNKVLSTTLMKYLMKFLPPSCCQDNFWLKYSLVRDGADYDILLRKIKGATRSIIAIQTTKGEKFGCFTSQPWRLNPGIFGSGEAFLWRWIKTAKTFEVFPYEGTDMDVQVCQPKLLACGVGGGGFGLCINKTLQTGTSSPSSTFRNPNLSQLGQVFVIANMEVWTFTPFSTVGEAHKSESRRLFAEGLNNILY